MDMFTKCVMKTLILIILIVNISSSDIKKCGHPGRPINGYVSNMKTEYYEGEAVEYRCNPGLVLFGSVTRVCTVNGTWSSVLPLCDESLPGIGNAVTSEGSTSKQDALLALDRKEITCTFMKKNTNWWRVDLGVQHHVLAVRVSMGQQGIDQQFSIYITGTGQKHNTHKRCASFSGTFATTTVILACDEGRGIPGQYVSIEDNRRNSAFFILCEVEIYVLRESYPCGEPETSLNSLIVSKKNERIRYECDKGFKMIGPSVRTCNASGAWSGNEPLCKEISCPSLRPVAHGIMRLTGVDPRKMVLGTVVKFNCHHGYFLNGNNTRICQDNGRWSGVQPKCLPVDCGMPKSIFPGEYYSLMSRDTTLASTARLHCTDGYNFSSSIENKVRSNVDLTVIIECEAVGLWNYTDSPTCHRIEGSAAEVVEEYSLDFTGGVIIGIIVMSLIILCILVSLFIIKWRRRRKNTSAIKELSEQRVASSISPSASSLVARGHYTPAEDIVWVNDGFYCELPVQSTDFIHDNLTSAAANRQNHINEQTTSLKQGAEDNRCSCNGNGRVFVVGNLRRSRPSSRETIYEEITGADANGKPASACNTSCRLLRDIPDDSTTLANNRSVHSLSELYAKVDFSKKRRSRLCSNLPSSSPASFEFTGDKNAHEDDYQNGGRFSPSVSTYRELPPIPPDNDSLDSSHEESASRMNLAIRMLDDAIYPLSSQNSTSEDAKS